MKQAVSNRSDKRKAAGICTEPTVCRRQQYELSVNPGFMSSIFQTAKSLWKIPVSMVMPLPVRANPESAGITIRSGEQERYPAPEAPDTVAPCFRFRFFVKMPIAGIVRFAVLSAMHDSGIRCMTWSPRNTDDKTVIIRNRKHPQEKGGNDQKIPLLIRLSILPGNHRAHENISLRNELMPSAPRFPELASFSGFKTSVFTIKARRHLPLIRTGLCHSRFWAIEIPDSFSGK